jgi:Right handed beta helix region
MFEFVRAQLGSFLAANLRRALCAVFAVVLSGVAYATTITVGPSGDYTTIGAAIAAAANGDTINVASGTYTENLILSKSLILLGAQAGVDACGRNPNSESIVTAASGNLIELRTGSVGSVINGFTFSGSSRQVESTTGPIDTVQILNNRFVAFTGNAVFLNDSGIDITVDQNLINGSSQTGGDAFHLDTDNFDGFRFTNNCVSDGVTGFFVDGVRNVGMSVNRAPLFSGNVFTNNETGINLGRLAFEDGEITNNIFKNSGFDGLQGGPKNATISGNTFLKNARSGLALTGFGGTGDAARGAQNNSVVDNCFMANQTQAVVFSSSQYAGTIATNTLNDNNILLNAAGAVYTGTETIDATSNYWGAADGPSGDGSGSGDTVDGQSGGGMISFTSFLTSLKTLACNANLPRVLKCVGFDAPANSGPIKVKKNRVIPYKAELIDLFTGLPVSNADISALPTIQVIYTPTVGPATDVTTDALSAGQGSDTNQFMFSGDRWAYNLSTKNYSASGTYAVTISSGDGDEYIISPTCTSQFVIQ